MWAWVRRLARRGAVTAGGGGRGFSGRARSHRPTFPLRIGAGPLSRPGGLETAKPTVVRYCTADKSKVSYKELKGLLELKSVFLIDVREKWEIAEYGQIPGSISIPLGEVLEALQMNPKHFKERYSHNMPSKNDCLVFFCLAGVRSNQALLAAKSLGFSRAQHYAGGFKEWTEFESSEKK
ncbi:hypothetical protein JRQ81_007015 [Phrynocephalus forsythii]|uniref:Rhodanese domain-containing protein n=1 Tax=Phrynocephalus forsythii TaxID=171643 RepID=A0A9Q0Y3L3_9SAUR|nr:hypothetical protein JRQ81_007015 [Phrynocephalus forsythii]